MCESVSMCVSSVYGMVCVVYVICYVGMCSVCMSGVCSMVFIGSV